MQKGVQNNLGRSDKLKIVNEEVGWVGETCDRQTNEMVTTAQSLPFSRSQRPDLLGNQNKLNTGLRAGWKIFDFLCLLTSIFWLCQNRGDGRERFLWVANIRRFKQAKFFACFTERRTLVY